MSQNDRQVGGDHYKAGTVQHWDAMAYYLGPAYFKGQVTKYVSRWSKKNGLQDLEKAEHFYAKMLEVYDEGICWELQHICMTPDMVEAFGHEVFDEWMSHTGSKDGDDHAMEASICWTAITATTIEEHRAALAMLRQFVEEVRRRGEADKHYTNQG